MDKRYPSDLSDEHWLLVQSYFEPPREHGGRPRKRPARELVNAIVTVMRNGCVWRALPKDFPPWQTVVTAQHRMAIVDSLFIKSSYGGEGCVINGLCRARG